MATRIAAASDLRFALEEVKQRFLAETPGAKIEIVYGASGKLYTQIVQGAPFDLFLSADQALVERLVESSLARADSQFLYARGHLVLWGLKHGDWRIAERGLHVFDDPRLQKIAIANPQHAPYGRAAEAALRDLGLWKRVQPHLVLGENVAQALQFVESGAADVGLVPMSLAISPALRDRGEYWMVPEQSYPPLQQSGAILTYAADPAMAQRFRQFLKSSEGRSILQKYGFTTP